MTPEQPERAAKYRRISDDREGEELGVTRQDEDLDDYANRHGYRVVASYSDNDISASTRSKKVRPDYQRMLKDARDRQFDVILAYTSSRLTRRPRELEDQIELAEKFGIRFEYVRSPSFDLNTSDGRRIARMLAANDAAEAEATGERVSRARRQQAERGQFGGGPRPFGWEVDGVTQIPAEVEVIRDCARKVLAGASLRGLARDLRAAQVPTVTGTPWTSLSLRRTLLRPRNAGLAVWQGEALEGDGTLWGGAILPRDIFERVRDILTDPDRQSNSGTAPVWLGTGIYRCGVCSGEGREVTLAVSGGYKGSRYFCTWSRHLTRHAVKLDEFVKDVLMARLLRKDALQLFVKVKPDVDVAGLRAERKAILENLRGMAEDVGLGLVTRSQLHAANSRGRSRITEIDSLLNSAMVDEETRPWLDAEDPYEVWKVATLEERKQILRKLVVVTVLPTSKRGRAGFDRDAVRFQWRSNR